MCKKIRKKNRIKKKKVNNERKGKKGEETPKEGKKLPF